MSKRKNVSQTTEDQRLNVEYESIELADKKK